MILVSRQLMSTVSCLALIEMTSLQELNPLHQHQLQAKQNSGSQTPFFCDVLFPLVLSSPRARSGASSSFVSQLPEHSMTGAVGTALKCVVLHVIGCTWPVGDPQMMRDPNYLGVVYGQ